MKKSAYYVLSAIFFLLPCTVTAQPEVPANIYDLPPISNFRGDNKFAYPHLPPYHTTSDGRIGIRVTRSTEIEFFLVAPESLDQHLLLSDRGIRAVPQAENYPVTGSDGAFSRRGQMFARNICEKNLSNPQVVEDKDRYNITIFGVVSEFGNGSVRLQSVDFEIDIENPKSSSARIVRIEKVADSEKYQTMDSSIYGSTRFVELNVTRDGKLLLGKMSSRNSDWNWTSPTNSNIKNTFPSGSRPTFYAYNDSSNLPCDISQWTDLHPLTHAFHDNRINQQYGFAQYQIRDAEGNLLADGEQIRGSQYPWLSQDGSMILMELNGEMLHYIDEQSNRLRSRYERTCGIPGANSDSGCALQNGFNSRNNADQTRYIGRYESRRNVNRGVVAVGRWTHGKMVELDNLLNYMDYGVNSRDLQHLYLNLYEPNPSAGNTTAHNDGTILISNNKQEGAPVIPLSMNEGAQIWSVENRFNFLPNMAPVTPRDIVWQVSKGNGVTEEVAFDDFIDPHVLIYAPMNTSFNNNKYDDSVDPEREMQGYNNGFKRTGIFTAEGFTEAVHYQNAATADDNAVIADNSIQQDFFDIPAYGVGIGDMRIEPIALGGVRGKGAWLSGANGGGIEFTIPAQSKSLESGSWYYGLFIDSRGETKRRLLTLPNGSNLQVNNTDNTLFLENASSSTSLEIPLPSTVFQSHQWLHIGMRVAPETINLYVNGNLFTELSFGSNQENPFILKNSDLPGNITLGAVNASDSTGVRAWIDEFKMIHITHEDLSQEMFCEHARGTLVGLNQTYEGPLDTLAMEQDSLGKSIIDNELLTNQKSDFTSERYACYIDYKSHLGAHLASVPDNSWSLRDALLIKSPLVFNQARPDATDNSFCLLCHIDGHPKTLNITDALGLNSAASVEDDPRRQPLQPMPLMYGTIPEFLLARDPSSPVNFKAEGVQIDRYLLIE